MRLLGDAPERQLVLGERDGGIEPGSAPRGQETGDECNRDEQQRDGDES